MKYVIVTAHPDDEILWCGGLPLLKKGDWTVICCSIPERDPIRAYKFFEACEVIGVKPRLIPNSEKYFDVSGLDLEEFDHIVTHNKWGEYGHAHHKLVNKHVNDNYSHKKITTIGYRPDGIGEIQYRLSPIQLGIKLNALRKYNHHLPYEGRVIPKWEALIHRYSTMGGLDLATETYDGAAI